MRIAINTLAMRPTLYGVGNYIKSLVCALAARDTNNEYVLVVSSGTEEHLRGLPANFSFLRAPVNRGARLLWEHYRLPAQMTRLGVDVLHSTHFTAPKPDGFASVVTFHDLSFLLMPKKHTVAKQMYFGHVIPVSARSAGAIIAVSENSKRDIVLLLRVPEDKVTVIHHGVDPRFQPVTDPAELLRVRTRYRLPEQYFLFVGMFEPRKNIVALLDAYETTRGLRDVPLVLAGQYGWGCEPLKARLAQHPRVLTPGYVKPDDLAAVYTMATAFVYPSLYEGFGFPVLEAMACGVPVISSNVSSIPEIAGDAALLVDPRSTAEIGGALRQLLDSPDLRRTLSERGLRRASGFTWAAAAEKTLRVYDAAAAVYHHPSEVIPA